MNKDTNMHICKSILTENFHSIDDAIRLLKQIKEPDREVFEKINDIKKIKDIVKKF